MEDLLATKLTRWGSHQANDPVDVEALCRSLIDAEERVNLSLLRQLADRPLVDQIALRYPEAIR